MSSNTRVKEVNVQNSFPTMDFQKYEILLFAEDVVSYLMNTKCMWRHTGFCSKNAAPRAGEYRHVVYNGFNEIVKKAVKVLFETHLFFIQRQFISILDASDIDDYSLKKHAKFLWEQQFSDGIDAVRFLRFCVVVTGLAGAFYLEGFKKSPDYAVQIIVYHFPRAECLKVTWNVLNRAALHYLKEKTGKTYSQLFDCLDDEPSSYMDFKNEYTCNCFQADLKEASFKKLYAIRENLLRYHFIICLRASFAEAIKQNLIRPTEDYRTEYPNYVSSSSNMEDKHFSGDHSGMSAILKISQAARVSEMSSDNNDYTISRNNKKLIPSNLGCHSDKSSVLKISRSAKCPEKSIDTLSKSPVKGIPKQTNSQADSVIFKIPKSVKRFKMSDNGNLNSGNEDIPLKSNLYDYPTHQSDLYPFEKHYEMFQNIECMTDNGNVNSGNKVSPLKPNLYNYPTYQSDSYPIPKLSEMFQSIESISDNGNVNNGNRVSPLKSDFHNNPAHPTASNHIAKLSEMFQNIESMSDNGNVNNGIRVSPLKSDLYNNSSHHTASYYTAKLSERFQNMESMSDSRNVNNAISLKSDLSDYPTYQSDFHPIAKPSEVFQDIESMYENGGSVNNNHDIPLKSDLYNNPTYQPDNHPITKLSEMFQNIESILNDIQTMKNRQK